MKIIIQKLAFAVALSLPSAINAHAQDADVEPLPAVKKSLRAAQDEMRSQLDRAKQQLAEVHTRVGGLVRRFGEGPGQPLVVRTSESDPKTQANLEEDLSVMSRILDKAARDDNDERPRHAMGINVLFGPGPKPIHSLYLEGYGTLFLVNVGFPLLPPPQKPEPPKEDQQRSSTWEETRRELYGQRKQRKGAGPPLEEYSEEKVARLKDALLEALKNAANIRDLKADEWVTVSVFGGAPVGVVRQMSIFKRSPDDAEELEDEIVSTNVPEPLPARATVMNIRVKKSDIEAFAKGNLNLDEFRKKTQSTIATRASDGGMENGGFSFGFGGGGFSGGGGFGGRP